VLTVDADAGAPTLVLIQPGGAVPEVFLPLMGRLAGRARLLAPDLPGHGATEYRRSPGMGPHGTLRGHVSKVLDAMEVGPCVVAGSSLGAHVAVSMALHEPDRTRAVVVFGSASTFAAERELHEVVSRHSRSTEALGDPASVHTARASLRRFVDVQEDHLSDVMVWAQLLSRTLPAVRRSSAALFADLVDRELVRGDLVAHRLGELRQPVLVFWGRQDRGAPVRLAEDGVGRLPRGSLVVLDQCGHLPYLEHVDVVAARLQEFLLAAERG
jgi:pimeloyl-ACP methyl ester carboxylesterase